MTNTLGSLEFVEAKSAAGLVQDLLGDYSRLMDSLPEARRRQAKDEERDATIRRYLANLAVSREGPRLGPVRNQTAQAQLWAPSLDAGGVTTLWTRLLRAGRGSRHPVEPRLSSEPVVPRAIAIDDEDGSATRRNAAGGESNHLDRFDAYQRFVRLARHDLEAFGATSGFCVQQAHNLMEGSVVGDDAARLLATRARLPGLLRSSSGSAGHTRPQLLSFKGHTAGVNAVALSADGRLLASASWDGTVRVWAPQTGECLHVLEGHTRPVRAVSITPDGRFAASGGDDMTVMVWDLRIGARRCSLSGHTSEIWSIGISADGARVVSGGVDRRIHVWSIDEGQCAGILSGHTKAVKAVAVTARGRWAVSGGADCTLRLWDLSSLRCTRELKERGEGVERVALSGDGLLAITGLATRDDRTVGLWDLARGRRLKTLAGHPGLVMAVALSGDGSRAVSVGAFDRCLRVWDVASGRCLRTVTDVAPSVQSVSLSIDAREVALEGAGQTVQVYSFQGGHLG
jgi:hypothetical protein